VGNIPTKPDPCPSDSAAHLESAGIPGCSVDVVDVFLPLKGLHEEVDPQKLAKTLCEKGRSLLSDVSDGADIDDRATSEAVCVVYDMSQSMCLPAFPDDHNDTSDDGADGARVDMTADQIRFEMWRFAKFEREAFDIIRAVSSGQGCYSPTACREACMQVPAFTHDSVQVGVDPEQK